MNGEEITPEAAVLAVQACRALVTAWDAGAESGSVSWEGIEDAIAIAQAAVRAQDEEEVDTVST